LEIGSGAFSDCTELYCVIIGDKESKLKKVGEMAFRRSSLLYSFTFYGSNEFVECGKQTFDSTLVKQIKVPRNYDTKN